MLHREKHKFWKCSPTDSPMMARFISLDRCTRWQSTHLELNRAIIVLEVFANRQSYDGPIQLQVGGLPPGTTIQGNEIPAGANGTLITFGSTADAAAPLVTRLR